MKRSGTVLKQGTRKKTVKTKRHRKKRHIRWLSVMKLFCVTLFIIAVAFFGTCRIALASYNIDMQKEDQSLMNANAGKQEVIHRLEDEIHQMMDKKRIMEIVGKDARDDSDNVYIIDNE